MTKGEKEKFNKTFFPPRRICQNTREKQEIGFLGMMRRCLEEEEEFEEIPTDHTIQCQQKGGEGIVAMSTSGVPIIYEFPTKTRHVTTPHESKRRGGYFRSSC